MIYLTEGNIPLNAAYDDEIVQEANSTYQLTFKFPTNNILWQRLREETFLIADDLHGEQDFVIFEVEKKHGYIQVYANQVMTMLNHYVVNPMSLDRQTGSTALSQFAGSITRENPFSFFSDIEDKHTFNIDSKNAMEAFTKDKHSILGLWGGDLVRHGYQVRLLKNGGSENESLFMYKKNLSSYEHKTSTKSLKTRITFTTTVRGEGENPADKHYKVVVDSPLINKYSQIYEDVVEVNDQDVVDEATLRKYGEQYFRTTLCDMLEDSIEIDVIGHSDVPVQMFDVVGVHHEFYGLDVRKKITKYNYSPMAKKLKSIGFGQFQSGLASAIGNVVSDAFKSENQHFQSNFERQLARELKNADLAFERKKEELTNQFTDEVNAIKAKSEENERALSDEIDRRFHEFSPEGFEEAKTKAEEALRKAGAIPDLQEKFDDLDREQTSQGVKLYRMENDFQYVKETAQLYERILGSSESDISRNASRLVMSDQVFQTEVGKYSTQGGPNLLRNSRADDGLKYWDGTPDKFKFLEHHFYLNGQKRMFLLENGAVVNSPRFIFKKNTDYTLNLLAFDANTARVTISLKKRRKNSSADFDENQVIFESTGSPAFSSHEAVKRSFKFNTGDFDNGYLVFEYTGNPSGWSGMFMTELDFYEGTNDRKWQPDPEDSAEPIEAVKTQVTQLAGSYAIQNLNSAGDIINGINLGANGNNRIIGRATHITGDTLIDNAVIKSAMIDKLKTANFEAGSVTTTILGAEAVTAEKVKFDTAFIQQLVSQQAFIDELFAKQATINRIQSIDFTGNNIKGGKISSLNSVTDFDLQTGWIDMNKEAVGIRNRFPNRPMQFLVFGQGRLNGVPGAYTALMSNRNGVVGIEHTSAGIQIWNGREGSNVQTAITFYGKTMDFKPNSVSGGVSINTETRVFGDVSDIFIKGHSLSNILNDIFWNFRVLSDGGAKLPYRYFKYWNGDK